MGGSGRRPVGAGGGGHGLCHVRGGTRPELRGGPQAGPRARRPAAGGGGVARGHRADGEPGGAGVRGGARPGRAGAGQRRRAPARVGHDEPHRRGQLRSAAQPDRPSPRAPEGLTAVDLALSPEQEALEKAVEAVLARGGQLSELGFLDVVRDAGPVEGVLVVEQAAAAAVDGPVAARVLAGPLAGVHDLPVSVGLLDGRAGLCRWGPSCEAFLVLDGDEALLASRDDVEVVPVASTFGATYAEVTVRRGARVASGDGLRRAWQVAIAAEAEGLMLAAIAK